jgi:hypothetical protein
LALMAAVWLVVIAACLDVAPAALASAGQETWLQDDPLLVADPVGFLQKARNLGVDRVRVSVRWLSLAPRPDSFRAPARFRAADPAAYPDAAWAPFDAIVRASSQTGVALNFNLLGGAPLWATGPRPPKGGPFHNWEPNPAGYAAFVQAVGTRYSGDYDPDTHRRDPGNPADLPRVDFWTVWNEPDYGPSLAPQGLAGDLKVEHSPQMYRDLVDAAWAALHRTGHGRDMFVFGEVAPRGNPNRRNPRGVWGVFSGMTPVNFIRNLYCLTPAYRPLRGRPAQLRGCPTSPAGTRAFAARHPALFRAGGFSVHPYSKYYAPDQELQNDPEYTSLADIGNLERALDRVCSAYGSRTRFGIWNTEYGYMTSPPKLRYDPYDHPPTYYNDQPTAAEYLNWAEYLSWRNPRIHSYMQYLLQDAVPRLRSNNFGGYASGLVGFGGKPKATYYAYRLPLFLPRTTASPGQSLEVWGSIRPAHYALLDTPYDLEVASVQFAPTGSHDYTTMAALPVSDPNGYFDTRIVFPGSGTVRLVWVYPSDDMQLLPGQTITSRPVQITIR